MQTLAKASGATLGYIVGNLPGAYIGYQFGKKFGKRMPPFPTPQSKRIRRMSLSSRSTGSSRTRTSRYTKSSARGVYDSVVTRQHDVGKQYRYKKMPKYKKRRWRKFVKKIQAVQLKQAGLRTVLFNSRGVLANDATFQQIVCLSLYGFQGSIDSNTGHGHNDLYRVFKNDPDIIQSGAAPGNVPKSGKLQFGSGVLDFTIRNLSADTEAEVDIYYGWYRKDSDQIGVKTDWNPIEKYKNAPGDLIKTGNTAVNIFNRGATLFDKPSGIAECGYHITKKMKMILAPAQSTFLQHRDPKNHMVSWENNDNLGFAKKGLTFGVWIIFKPSVTAADDAVVTLGFGVTRKYSYALVEDNVDRVALNPPN